MNETYHDGGCICAGVRYRMSGKPLFVHGCHCRWCQRETGSAFAHNALIEAPLMKLLCGDPEVIDTPSYSGKGQKISRCPACRVAVWSNYAGAGASLNFLRVGTLDDAGLFPPDIHIFTVSKQSWLILPPGVPAVLEYYKASEYWPIASLERRERLRAEVRGP